MKAVNVSPITEFKDRLNVVRLADGSASDIEIMHMFEHRLLTSIVETDGLPHALATAFLTSVALRSRSATGDTVRTYGEALVPWLLFLRQRKIPLESATEEFLRHYANSLVNASKADGTAKYAAKTSNLRTVVAAQFHTWGQRHGRMPSPLGAYLLNKVAERGQFRGSHFEGKNRAVDPIAHRVVERLPRVLSREEITRLFLVCTPEYRLMFRWAVATGMRRFEVCDLPIRSLPTAEQIASRGLDLVPIEIVRKGSRIRTVQAPSQLVEETLWHLKLRSLSTIQPEHRHRVFVSARGCGYSRQSLTRAFRKAANQIGSSATLHHLRHTFAVHVLSALESAERSGKAINSMKTLQILLGHANVTTVEIYLRAVEASSDGVRDALDFLYGATL